MSSRGFVILDDWPQAELPLAKYIQARRLLLGLTIDRAAQLSGMEFSQWCAIEGGWVPEKWSNLLWAVAGTLEASTTTIILLADRQRQITAA